jgi:hypothetical protein
VEGIWAEIERVSPAHSGCTLDALAAPACADGIVIPLRPESVQLTRRPPRLDPIATPGIDSVSEQGAPLTAGAAMLPGVEPGTAESPANEEDEESVEEDESRDDDHAADEEVEPVPIAGRSPTPTVLRFDASAWPGLGPFAPADEHRWRLVVRRRLYDHGTLVQSAESLVPLVRSQQLRVSPQSLEQLGVGPGDEVRVRSGRGEVVVPAVGDGGVPAGVALLEFNAAPAYETSASALIDWSVPAVEIEVEKVI